MPTIAEQLTQLQTDKQTLVDNLVAKGVEATSDETFTSLVPKVADIQAGGGGTEDFEINDASYLFYRGARLDIYDELMAKMKKPTTLEYFMYNSYLKFQDETLDLRSLDLSQCTNMNYALANSSRSNGDKTKYMYLPNDFSSLTTANYMFSNKYQLTDLDLSGLNIPNKIQASNMFGASNFYGSLKLPNMKITTSTNIFGNSSFYLDSTNTAYFPLDLTPIDFSENSQFSFMFNGVNTDTIIAENGIDMSSVTSLNSSSFGSNKLVNIPVLKNLGKAYNSKSANYSNYTLTLSSCPNLTHESLMNVINGLYDLNLTYDVANGGTLYTQKLVLGATNLAKLTEEEIAIATAKGWSVS